MTEHVTFGVECPECNSVKVQHVSDKRDRPRVFKCKICGYEWEE